jgi:hypothetical protein
MFIIFILGLIKIIHKKAGFKTPLYTIIFTSIKILLWPELKSYFFDRGHK